MIDNEKEVRDLIADIERHLPLRANATAELVNAVRGKAIINDVVTIESVKYSGDEGGIVCSLEPQDDGLVVVVSLTHLRIGADHSLAPRIEAYQRRRTHVLDREALGGSRESRSSVATKKKRGKTRAAPNQASKKAKFDPRFDVACDLWGFGKYRDAAPIFLERLRQDPDDPHFCRYWLASSLYQLGALDALETLLRGRDDPSGVWRFLQALLAFRLQGDNEDSQKLLVEADHLEPGFEDYLLREKVVDSGRPVRFDGDDAERAEACARLFLPAWRGTPGAAAWARRVLKTPPMSVEPDSRPRQFPRNALQGLPTQRGAWQVGLVRSNPEDETEGTPIWLLGVANVDKQEMRALTVIDQPLTETVVWDRMLDAFRHPMEGVPAKPTTLVIGRRDFRDAWKPLLTEIGIRCQCKEDPQPMTDILKAMAQKLAEDKLPPAEGIDITAFPQSAAVWQADFVRAPTWVMNEEEGSYRPWMVLILDKSRSVGLTSAHTPGDPAPEMLLEFLIRTMAKPGGEAAERPRLVELSDSDCYDYLKPRLETAGIGCRLVDEMPEFNEFCLGLAKSFDGSGKCALADGQGVTNAQMESFYETAAYYFREAPWNRVPGEVPIEIRCDDPAMGTRYGIVLGRTGVQMGLCIYDDWKITQSMLAGDASPDENRALAVCFDEAEVMAAVDLQLIERKGWPIATPEAWPAVLRVKPGQSPVSANAAELTFLEACLRAIPDFIKSEAPSAKRKVETGTGTVVLALAWQ